MSFVCDITLAATPFARGHFGEVFEGNDPIHGRVAVKVFRREAGEPAGDWDRRKAELLSEGQRLKDAEHERIVRVFSVVADPSGDAVLLEMEYCAGGSLLDEYNSGPMRLARLRQVLFDA